ncbi:MAG: DegQ family serine endoprotease [Gammaproteobacteria bacterium]|nr:DegQ family serine endoprotease [Gammaproteobacteria bacterium]MDH3465999.1 DegQ family serine endoprotease [Gammaproteobacteria bacterium]
MATASRYQRQCWAALFTICLISPAAESAFPVAVDGEPLPSLAPMLERVRPAVVNIATESVEQLRDNPLLNDPFFRRFFNLEQGQPRQRRSQSLGSGIVLDAEHGYIVTNSHVIQDADEITVTLHDGREFSADVVGADPDADIAVIKIPPRDLTAIRSGDSDRLRVGDFVVAIGNPFGLNQTVTSGIVSALGRSGLGIEGYEDFIQTDASINVGNSGGALVNLRGELVGVNTAILSRSGGSVGIGFAIPVNMARNLVDQIVEFGEVRRGRLGILIQDLTPELAQAFGLANGAGALITQVLENSPAQQAGLKDGDIVLQVNGRSIRNAADLSNTVGLLRVGDKVRLRVFRDGESRIIRAHVAQPNEASDIGKRLSAKLEGATLRSLEDDPERTGVLVVAVESDTPAWRAGLRENDVIVSINRKPVRRLSDIENIAKRNPGALLLNIQRDNGALFLVLR